MKTKSVIIFGLASLIILMIISGGLYFNDYQEKQQDLLSLEQQRVDDLAIKLHQRDSLVNDYVETFDQIEKDLLIIKEKENLLNSNSQDPEMTKSKRVQITEDIQLIYSLVEENRKKIANLSRKLKSSGVEIAALNEKVKLLSDAIEERDNSINELNQVLADKDIAIEGLNTKVEDLENVVVAQKGEILEKKMEMNKAFITIGDFRTLKEKGIITKDGGFLGLGKTKTLETTLADSSFTKIDITETKSYPVYSKKVELITEHPEGSYEWIEEEEQIAYMVISDPKEFWKISKYAVLETR